MVWNNIDIQTWIKKLKVLWSEVSSKTKLEN